MSRYNRDEVLKRAILAFWQYGYTDCSVRHLEEATGLHPGSLYYHFKNKDHLYNSCITFYLTDTLLPKIQSVSSFYGFQQFFMNTHRERMGQIKSTCFLIQAASEVAGHTLTNRAFKSELEALESAFTEKVGMLAPGYPEITDLLMDLYIALHIYSEQAMGRNMLDDKIKQRFDLIRKICSDTQPVTH